MRLPSRNFLLISLLLVVTKSAWTQEVPVFSQFTRNPYLYNPAFAGSTHAPVAYLTHRRQWMGIEGAPVTTVFSLHAPLKFRDRLGWGVKLANDSRGLLNTSSALVGLSYCVSFSDHQQVRIGSSVGGGTTQLLEYDPALADYPNNRFSPQGEVGVLYRFKDTRVSFALPRVFRAAGVLSGSDRWSPSPLRHVNFMGSQSVALSPRVAVEPSLLYRITESLPNQFEVVGMLHLYDALRLGASYRQDYGPSVLAEFHRQETFGVGYAYELATSPAGGLRNGTHEVQLSLRLGKERKAAPDKAKTKPKPAAEAAPPSRRRPPKPEFDDTAKPVRTAGSGEQGEPSQPPPNAKVGQALREGVVTIRRSTAEREDELESEYYVVVGAFDVYVNAARYKDRVLANGLYAELKFSSETKRYYVYLLGTTHLGQAVDGRNKIRKLKAYRKAWILAVE